MIRHIFKRSIHMKNFFLLFSLLFTGCLSVPEGVGTVKGFELERYLGRWYEIARLDHSFERGLVDVTAEYAIRDDGGVKVINRGYHQLKQEWKEIEGKAFFQDTPDKGLLKVSFFGPFYGTYNIVELDKINYSYALVCGPDRSYLWILARTPKISKKISDDLMAKASSLGFDTSKLILVEHSRK